MRAPRCAAQRFGGRRPWVQTEKHQADSTPGATGCDRLERIGDELRAQAAGGEKQNVVETIFENDDVRRSRRVALHLQKRQQTVERPYRAEKTILDLVRRRLPLKLEGPAFPHSGVGAAEQQNFHAIKIFMPWRYVAPMVATQQPA